MSEFKDESSAARRLRSVKFPLPRSDSRVARLRWWLLPHIGFYSEGWDKLMTTPAYWLWNLTAYLPGSEMYAGPEKWESEWDELPTRPDPRLIAYADHGEPELPKWLLFLPLALALTAIGWIIWEVAHAL